MIDHLTLTVSDLERSKTFYATALAPLGYKALMQFEAYLGFGAHKPEFWIKEGELPSNPMHIAFVASDRPAVDAFHAAALAAGGRDNGGPGPRAEYHPHYYGAFVFDVDGHPIEAVCHLPAARKAAPKAGAKAPKAMAGKKAAPKAKAAAKPAAPKAARKPSKKAAKAGKAKGRRNR